MLWISFDFVSWRVNATGHWFDSICLQIFCNAIELCDNMIYKTKLHDRDIAENELKFNDFLLQIYVKAIYKQSN